MEVWWQDSWLLPIFPRLYERGVRRQFSAYRLLLILRLPQKMRKLFQILLPHQIWLPSKMRISCSVILLHDEAVWQDEAPLKYKAISQDKAALQDESSTRYGGGRRESALLLQTRMQLDRNEDQHFLHCIQILYKQL
jgi:hypothetical protein